MGFLNSSDILDINQQSDTIFLKHNTSWNITTIWSRKDSVTIYMKNCTHYVIQDSVYANDYETALIKSWDIDSIVILCQYNRAVYYEMPYNYVYRYIVSNGNITVEGDVYGGYPAEPDFMVDEQELEYRRNYREYLKKNSYEFYNQVFNRQGKPRFDPDELKPKISLPQDVGLNKLSKRTIHKQ